jgi:hypothetical protein
MIQKYRALLFLFVCFVSTILAPIAMAQQRPLVTEDSETLQARSARFDFGVDFLHHKDFPLSGLTGNLTDVGVVTARYGVASNVEAEIGGVIRKLLSIQDRFRPSAVPLSIDASSDSTHDTGDFYLATKMKLRTETNRTPAMGFRFGAELPNSDQARGIGVNQTNFFATVLAAKQAGKRARVIGNVGLGILTAPVDLFTQNDVFLYGLAMTYFCNDRLTLVAEVNGRDNTRSRAPIGTESEGQARFGARFRAAGLFWDVAGIRGVQSNSGRGGVTFGMSYELHR